MKIFPRIIAAFLSLTICTQSFTNICYAAEDSHQTDTPYSEAQDPILNEQPQKKASIIAEDETKRTEFSKTFLMSDGSYTLALYKEPVHYQDAAGNWQDIDNTLSIANETDDDTSPPNSPDDQNVADDSGSVGSPISTDSQNDTNDNSGSSVAEPTNGNQNDDHATASSESVKQAEDQGLSAASSAVESYPDTASADSRVASEPASLSGSDRILQGASGDADSDGVNLSDDKAVVVIPELVNKAAKSKIKLSTKLKSGKTVMIKRDGRTLKWGLEGADAVRSHVVAHNASDVEQNGDDRFLAAKKVTSEVAYDDAFPNVDVHYILQSNDVKENIILKSKNTQAEFTEIYYIGEMTAKQKDDKTIELFDKSDKDQKTPVYILAAPEMQDASGVFSDNVSIEIMDQEEGKLSVRISADENWLQDDARVYPVTVDPYVFTSQDPATISDTFISQRESGTNFGGNGAMYLGNETANYGACRILVKTQLPSLSKGDMVVGAKLRMVQYPDGFSSVNSDMEVDAHAITSAWTEQGATWNNMSGNYSGTTLDYFKASKSTNSSYNDWDVTKTVKSWYNGSTNNGIMLKAKDESAMSRNEYLASNNPGFNDCYPGLVINYVSNEGLENYWDYHTQSNNRAGMGHVNDYTGNLVYTVPILSETGEKTPLSISFIYNGYNSGNHFMGGTRGGCQRLGLADQPEPADRSHSIYFEPFDGRTEAE